MEILKFANIAMIIIITVVKNANVLFLKIVLFILVKCHIAANAMMKSGTAIK